MTLAVGYVTIEGWGKAVSAEYDVYAAQLLESHMYMNGMQEKRTHLVLVSQPIDDEVHYCRIPVGITDSLMNESLVDKLAVERAAKQAWIFITEWLAENHHTWKEAVVGIPKDIVPLDGRADFLVYQPKLKGYIRMDGKSSG